MTKFCIFCGNPPIEKNKEHVIPRWLIELTGDPNRVVNLGLIRNSKKPFEQRSYAFDQFTFPACEACNTKHSSLEGHSKRILLDILNERPLSATDISNFLDWLDKIRVGLWLAFYQLNRNFEGVDPKFHIEKRIGQYDRMVIVEKNDGTTKRLNFTGTDSPAFAYIPSAFSLSINNYIFTNISSYGLVSRRLGFPFPSEMRLDPQTSGMNITLSPGRERIMRPVLQRNIKEKGLSFYQPMFANGLASERAPYYDSDYVKDNSLNHASGFGSIFFENESKILRQLSSQDAIVLSPTRIQKQEEHILRSVINTHEWQSWFVDTVPSLELLDYDHRKYVHTQQRYAKAFSNLMINHHRKLLIKWGYSP